MKTTSPRTSWLTLWRYWHRWWGVCTNASPTCAPKDGSYRCPGGCFLMSSPVRCGTCGAGGGCPPLRWEVVVTDEPYHPVCSPVSDVEDDTGSLGSDLTDNPVEVEVPPTSPSNHGEVDCEHVMTALPEQLEPRRSLVSSILIQPDGPCGLDLRVNHPSPSPSPAVPRLCTLGAVCPCNCHCTLSSAIWVRFNHWH